MKFRRNLIAATLPALLTGCLVGPSYQRPAAPVPDHYKEAEGWKPAEPGDAASNTDWWTIYDDSALDDLEKQVDVSNQTLKASEAAWRQASALADQARAGLFPSVSLDAGATRSHSTSVTAGEPTSSATSNQYSLGASASWDLDVWGKIRRLIESDVATAQASRADLAAARLSTQAMLATDYFELRFVDQQLQLLDQSVVDYQRSSLITENQYKVGVASKADVIAAQELLDAASNQRLGLVQQRAQLEHAIAVLVGKAPADFSIAPADFRFTVPAVPTGLPSALLERRPDIAEAERKMAAANAEIGVAIAAYFPDLSLSGSYGFANNVVDGLVKAPNAAWAFGGEAAETLVDFGARSAAVKGARAGYDAAVASYRQAVLTAFQQVEDELVAVHTLEQQDMIQDRTTQGSNQSAQIAMNQYRAGTIAYSTVVNAQVAALVEAQTLITIRQSRLVASISLIEALGGGWKRASLQPG